jgi:hypothetical protein
MAEVLPSDNPAEAGRYVESFIVETWGEHMCQHDRRQRRTGRSTSMLEALWAIRPGS